MKEHLTSQAGEPAGAQATCRAALSTRILVVDDDVDIRLLIAALLFRSGYQVDTAEDGETGWEALQARSYDLLITDNKMPKVSGVELVKQLRSAHMALPVILASGAMPEDLNRLPWLQLAATLLKPFSTDELLATVKRVLDAPQSAREQIESLPVWRSQPRADALWAI
jgi:DNA-binding response OmpR family regulator